MKMVNRWYMAFYANSRPGVVHPVGLALPLWHAAARWIRYTLTKRRHRWTLRKI
jgi:hypothetical protein